MGPTGLTFAVWGHQWGQAASAWPSKCLHRQQQDNASTTLLSSLSFAFSGFCHYTWGQRRTLFQTACESSAETGEHNACPFSGWLTLFPVDCSPPVCLSRFQRLRRGAAGTRASPPTGGGRAAASSTATRSPSSARRPSSWSGSGPSPASATTSGPATSPAACVSAVRRGGPAGVGGGGLSEHRPAPASSGSGRGCSLGAAATAQTELSTLMARRQGGVTEVSLFPTSLSPLEGPGSHPARAGVHAGSALCRV